nr:MAG TPA: YjcQ protein [Caudoviricetes sp.]
MRLNFDCVRAIMLWAEELTTPTHPAVYVNLDSLSKTSDLYLDSSELPVPDDHQQALLSNYSNEVLVYHLAYCIRANLLVPEVCLDANLISIKDLTPEGHAFLENIRSDAVYNKVKKICKKLGIESLSGIVHISESVVTEIIKAYLANPF